MEYPHSFEEQMAATAVAALAINGKRERGDSPDAAGGTKKLKMTNNNVEVIVPVQGPALPPPPPQNNEDPKASANSTSSKQLGLKPFPYFYYRDFSEQCDPDPLTPLTAPGRVPNFPAKMHSILSRPDLADVVAWMPHGRSWRVLKPREFEIRVIPTYFEHAKFSSFIRQANGWGFRRITQGRDRNSYYHEMFLRGLPHLCKMMKRPGVSEKQAADPEHEPDFYKISEEHPVPEKAEDDSILLQCTLQGGPKARMPIYMGSLSATMNKTQAVPAPAPTVAVTTLPQSPTVNATTTTAAATATAPLPAAKDTPIMPPNFTMNPYQQPFCPPNVTFNTGNDDKKTPTTPFQFPQMMVPPYNMAFMPHAFMPNGQQQPQQMQAPVPAASPVAAAPATANPADAAAAALTAATSQFTMMQPPNMAAAYQASSAASQFAAGFAAATALSHQQFKTILEQALKQNK